MPGKKQINAQVSQSQRKRWKEYARETNRSLSDLIRLAVEKEINQEEQSSTGPDEVTRQLSTVVDTVERIEQKAGDLETRLQSVETEVKDDPNIKALANDVFEVLPDSEEEVMEAQHQDLKGTPTPPETKASSGHIEDIAATLDEPIHQVRAALDHLQEETTLVQTVVWNDGARYYKGV